MRWNVAAELKLPGSTGHFEGEYPQAALEYGGRKVEFSAPISLIGAYSFDGEGFTVRGHASTVLYADCAKCNRRFDEPFSFDFEERFEKQASEDDGIYGYIGEVLDLSQMVLDNLLLKLPMRSLCKPDCKGLCPHCGCDLNMAQCSCSLEEEVEKRNPLPTLGRLLNDDKEV